MYTCKSSVPIPYNKRSLKRKFGDLPCIVIMVYEPDVPRFLPRSESGPARSR